MRSLMISLCSVTAAFWCGCTDAPPLAVSPDAFDEYHGHASGTALLSGATFARGSSASALAASRDGRRPQSTVEFRSSVSTTEVAPPLNANPLQSLTVNGVVGGGGRPVVSDPPDYSSNQPATVTGSTINNSGSATFGLKPITISSPITIKGSFPEPTIPLPDK